MEKIGKQIWSIVDSSNANLNTRGELFNGFILLLIVLNAIAVSVETIPSLHSDVIVFLRYFEYFSISLFSLEYLLKLIFCTYSPAFSHPFWGRVRFATQPLLLIDLIAIVPFFFLFIPVDLRFIRIFRLFRLLHIFKSVRYINAFTLFKKVLIEQFEELVISFFIMTFILFTSSCLLFYFENPVQPNAFASIPHTLWWAVSALTSVGYGDIVPISIPGKIISSIVSILGIAFVALPAGIISSGFVEELRNKKQSNTCPHCGKNIH